MTKSKSTPQRDNTISRDNTPTFEARFENFNCNWKDVIAPHYDEIFYRMW